MTKNKIGLLACVLMSAMACGDSTSDTGDGTTGGGGTGGTNDAASNGGTSGGDTTGGTSGGGTSNGGGNAGNTNTTGVDEGEGGVPAGGACTNAADMAIIDAATVAKLGCEGAACAGKHIMDAPGQTMCISTEAPTLKTLSAGCQKCFDDITSCVPGKCVSLLGGSGECSLSLPNTDFAKCPSTAKPEASCQTCQMRECAPAFTACSGISM